MVYDQAPAFNRSVICPDVRVEGLFSRTNLSSLQVSRELALKGPFCFAAESSVVAYLSSPRLSGLPGQRADGERERGGNTDCTR